MTIYWTCVFRTDEAKQGNYAVPAWRQALGAQKLSTTYQETTKGTLPDEVHLALSCILKRQ